MSTAQFRKCAKCGKTSVENNLVPYHRFPNPGTTNILRATAWATYCWPECDWSSVHSLTLLHKKGKVLCGNHFQDSCYTDHTKKRISKYAVPGTKEYIIKLLHTLRSKISSAAIVQQVDLPREPVAGCSGDPVTLVEQPSGSLMEAPKLKVDLPREPVAGCSGDPVTPVEQPSRSIVKLPKLKVDLPREPVAGCSEDPVTLVEQPSGSILESPKPKVDLPIAGCLGDALNPVDQPSGSVAELLKPMESDEPTQKKKRRGILKYLDKSKLDELSATERKLYVICKKKLNLISKLKRQIRKKPKVDQIQRICEDQNVKRLFDLKLSDSFLLMLQSQLLNSRRKLQGKRYNVDQKILALTFYKKSPACYRLLRRIFALPCPTTLNRLLNNVPMMPGINQQIFNGLQAMVETMTEEDSICTLVFDEMSIRKHLHYNSKTDSVDGFEDKGNHGRTDRIACNALVFMVCGIRKRWKQPIAYYLSGNSGSADNLSIIVKEVLTECFKIGLNVVATICDMCTVNIKALRVLGATTETPYFSHDGREIVTIADPPHLLKCLRNMFIAHDIQLPAGIQPGGNIVSGTAKWDHIRMFYELDHKNPNFVYAPALTVKHINPNSKQKMRVKLAAQVFSHTVTAGILAKVATNELPAEAIATATLLKNIDNLFDALNANSPDLRRGKSFSSNLTARSPHLKYFGEMKTFISGLKFVSARQPPSQAGWIRTLIAVERLWNNLLALGIQSLSTRRLNQDPLENFFGCVRYHCGSNYNPTISQFIAGFKTAIITNLKNTGNDGNCEADGAVLYDNLKSFLLVPDGSQNSEDIPEFQDVTDMNISADIETDQPENEVLNSEMQACSYVCGFILKKINTSCDVCNVLLKTKPGSEPCHIFTEFKEYDDQKSALNYATYNLVVAVEQMASICNTFYAENLHLLKIREKIMITLNSECRDSLNFLQLCTIHSETNRRIILSSVFNITLKRCLILKNRQLSEEASQRALQRKMKILRNN